MNSKLKMYPWYKSGLPFKCTGCGKCCEGSPGYIWVSKKEVEEIATFLKISIEKLTEKYLIQVGDKLSIRDLKHANYRCVFLKDSKCQIYPVRPIQCRTYPFWPNILKNSKEWNQEANVCEGIRTHHEIVPFDEIEEKKALSVGEAPQ